MRNHAVKQVPENAGMLLLKQIYERDVSGVSDEISPLDTMLEGDRQHYYSVGQSALRSVKLAMLSAGKQEFHEILDFACGFGRVLRVLRAAFPAANLTACDVSREGIQFCAQAFDAEPVLSAEQLSDIQFRRQFDLIWCGSLLTHCASEPFFTFLNYFASLLMPNGVLIFTTHGPFVAQRMRSGVFNYGLDESEVAKLLANYDTTGMGYGDYPNHVPAMVGVTRYGISVSRPSWVCGQIERVSKLRILSYCERAWDNHQDAVTCINPSE
jgi:2-polyprenyl-3-methyl-5-hydroxy-6-metoxy-1,4-benzoquinol methylase